MEGALKDLSIVVLYDLYSPLLSEKQRTVFEYYYNDDLSLSEIAEHTLTTRQGVRDLLKRSEEQLRAFEAALRLKEKTDLLEKLKRSYGSDPALCEKLDEIIRM